MVLYAIIDSNVVFKGQVEKIMKIEGMMCPHCEARVRDVLSAIEGVSSANVSHTDGTAKLVCSDSVTDSALRTAVENAGYKVKEIN